MARPTTIFNDVAETVSAAILKAEDYFHKVALDALEKQVALGNNVYSVMVDGKPVSDKSMVNTAKKSVKFNFPLRSIELALSIMKQAMQAEIGLRATESGKMKGSVRIWHGGIGKPPKEVSSVTAIKNFEVGDYVMLVPDIFYFAFANSVVADRTGKGFMVRTAIRIRRALKLTKKTAGLSIVVGRSRAVGSKMDIPPNRSNKQRERVRPAKKFPGTAIAGVPVLYIRWKVNQYRVLGA